MLPIATISLSSPLTRGPNRALASRSIVFVGSEFHTLDGNLPIALQINVGETTAVMRAIWGSACP